MHCIFGVISKVNNPLIDCRAKTIPPAALPLLMQQCSRLRHQHSKRACPIPPLPCPFNPPFPSTWLSLVLVLWCPFWYLRLLYQPQCCLPEHPLAFSQNQKQATWNQNQSKRSSLVLVPWLVSRFWALHGLLCGAVMTELSSSMPQTAPLCGPRQRNSWTIPVSRGS